MEDKVDLFFSRLSDANLDRTDLPAGGIDRFHGTTSSVCANPLDLPQWARREKPRVDRGSTNCERS